MADLDTLLTIARNIKMSASEKEEQRRSFAYGNAGFENARITREMVNEQAEKLAKAND
jgi:hypothetical protein